MGLTQYYFCALPAQDNFIEENTSIQLKIFYCYYAMLFLEEPSNKMHEIKIRFSLRYRFVVFYDRFIGE